MVGDRYKSTGKERDSESGLDYFGARYLSSNFGRFMTPDWASTATAVPYAQFGDPQSLDLYVYVGNHPNTGIDVDGHFGEQDYGPPPVDAAVEMDGVTDRPVGADSASYDDAGSSSGGASTRGVPQTGKHTAASGGNSSPNTAQQQNAPLTDKSGNVVQGANGKPALIPGGFDVGAVVQAGKGTGDLRKVAPMVGAAATAEDLANFGRGGKWDLQRLSGNFDPRYIDSATILIGMYAAASNITRNQILDVENTVARGSTYAKGTVMDSTYTHLPVRNVTNTDIGMRLIQSGSYVP